MCHSFRAAFLWSGRVSDGERLIAQLWEKSKGVIPNYTTLNATTNNSADALPLLLLTTADLIDFNGWSDTLRNISSSVESHLVQAAQVLNTEGGLIRHGPADTWMDAQRNLPTGKQVACSPRADRAFEIQSFWIAALARWTKLLATSHDHAKHAELFNAAIVQGLATLRARYFNPVTFRWADTLRPDDTPDFSLRPNILLGFSALEQAGCLKDLLDENELKQSMKNLVDADLIVHYGVRTLSPESSVKHPLPINELLSDETAYIYENKIHFHPYHEFGSRQGMEHPDWAYHNGTIWPWLSHSAYEMLIRCGLRDEANQLFETLVWYASEGPLGGALPELLDGVSNHSQWSWPKGAPHQAWSEAAFIHIFVEEMLGIQVKNSGSYIQIDTCLWHRLPAFSFEFALKDCRIFVAHRKTSILVKIQGAEQEKTLTLEFFDSSKPHQGKLTHALSAHRPFEATLSLS